jgi:hypothetical protein
MGDSIVNYTALLGYASNTFTHPELVGDDNDESTAQWFTDFRRIIGEANIVSNVLVRTVYEGGIANFVPQRLDVPRDNIAPLTPLVSHHERSTSPAVPRGAAGFQARETT